MRVDRHARLALLSNRASRAILERLGREPACATTLVSELRLPPLEVAYRLCELVGARLVRPHGSGEHLLYFVDADGVAWLDAMATDA